MMNERIALKICKILKNANFRFVLEVLFLLSFNYNNYNIIY